MLTIHAADEVRRVWDDPEPLKDGAVAVEGSRVVGVGPLAEIQERFPGARVRRWPGVLGPARVHEGPLPGAPTPRERVHAVLKSGAVAVLAMYVDAPELRAAAERNDVVVLPGVRPAAIVLGGRADLAVLDGVLDGVGAGAGAATGAGGGAGGGACLVTVCAGRLVHRRR